MAWDSMPSCHHLMNSQRDRKPVYKLDLRVHTKTNPVRDTDKRAIQQPDSQIHVVRHRQAATWRGEDEPGVAGGAELYWWHPWQAWLWDGEFERQGDAGCGQRAELGRNGFQVEGKECKSFMTLSLFLSVFYKNSVLLLICVYWSLMDGGFIKELDVRAIVIVSLMKTNK